MVLAPEATGALAALAVRVQLARRAASLAAPAFVPHPYQRPPAGDWRIWLLLGGRGSGKTLAGSEWVHAEVLAGRARRVALVAPTAADARDVLVEGHTGLLARAHPAHRPTYEPSRRRLEWPNGAIATTYSAEEPDRLRGPQHDLAWCDELATWPGATEAWDTLLLGLRLGADPRMLATTTPRPIPLLRALLDPARRVGLAEGQSAEPTPPHRRADVALTRGSTAQNAANLPPAFMTQIMSRYAGTRLGRQELEGELIEDVEGALWQRAMLEACRVERAPELARVVVAIDPAMTSGEDADETGMVVAGKGIDGRGYVLADLSGRSSPERWARRAADAAGAYGADRVIAEVNNGGDLVGATLRAVAPELPYRTVHASRGKRVRAEPIAALYEQGRVRHVGAFPALEDQLCTFVADGHGPSPDRLDALVWALSDLMLKGGMQAW